MRVLMIAPANSIHVVRWANGLSANGVEVHVASLHVSGDAFAQDVVSHHLPYGTPLGYVAAAGFLRNLAEQIKPDIVNAHYASGYGLLARLCGVRPLMLSVWGSDVYDFPRISPLHRDLLRRNLMAATLIGSTSYCMARKVTTLLPTAKIEVTPFGVDADLFHPVDDSGVGGPERVTVGTVKTLAPKYGIDTLIDAFAELKRQRPASKLLLEISGEGPRRVALARQAHKLNLDTVITFHGAVPHELVPGMLRRLDIFVALSRLDSESFGVAAVEAAMCGLPVVVSDADGLKEVVENGVTGFVVPRNDPAAAAVALRHLVESSSLRIKMGKAGRERALALYTWRRSVDLMIGAYEKAILLEAKQRDRNKT